MELELSFFPPVVSNYSYMYFNHIAKLIVDNGLNSQSESTPDHLVIVVVRSITTAVQR